MPTSRLIFSPLLAACLMGALAFAWPVVATAGPVLDRIQSKQAVVIAHRESSIPFSYLDPEGRPTGYAVALCLKVAEAVRKSLKLPEMDIRYVQVTPSDRIEVIEAGKADLECGSTTNNAERRKRVAFTVPHYIAGARYLVRRDSTIQRLEDFRDRRVVSTKGTTPLKELHRAEKKRSLGIHIVHVPDHARAIEMVESKAADGFVMDDVLLFGLAAGWADGKQFKVVGKFLTIEPLAIMFQHDDPAFKKLVDTEMMRLIRRGEAHEIYRRWFEEPIPPMNRSLNLPMNYLLKDFWKYPTDQVPSSLYEAS